MAAERWPFRGLGRSRALALDVPTIGEAQARSRVLEYWQPGAAVALLPDGRWLLILPQERDWRADRAPGLPGELRDGQLWLDVAGRRTALDVARLPAVGVHDWWRPDGLALVLLTPAEEPLRPEPVAAPPPVARPDLRSAAKVRPDPRAELVAAELHQVPGGPPGGGPPAPRAGHDWLARLTLRSPAGDLVRRRHARYLAELTRDFETRRFDDALRKAIALGGEFGGLSLRLPTSRFGPLRARTGPAAGGRSIAFGGANLHTHLSGLYRSAADQLEQAGRIDEAAFALADLLGDVQGAVRLLERHGQLAEAAALAEARLPDPAAAVRLWWLAGERERAVRLARARGAFAAAVGLLGPTDPEAARAVRAEWAAALRAAGDHLAAVEVAWREPSLRPAALADVTAGMALGGPVAAQLFAHLVTYRPQTGSRDAALALLDGDDPELTASREAFVRALAELTSQDPGHDRALAGAALRALSRGSTSWPKPELSRLAGKLRRRADPLLVADLVAPAPPAGPAGGPLEVTAVPVGSPLPVLDAAVVGGGVLVALGDLGVRLLTRDGRTAARWDLPAGRLVVADHGGTVLLVVGSGDLVELHRLDVATRQVRRWATVRLPRILPSFDGALLVGQDAGGLVWLDTTQPAPRAVWRELDAGTRVHAVTRSAQRLAALVTVQEPGWQTRDEIWTWVLPSLRLLSRQTPPPDPAADSYALTQHGELLVHSGEPEPGMVTRYEGQRPTARRPAAGWVLADGAVEALLTSAEGWWQVEVLGRDLSAGTVLRLPSRSAPQLRGQGRVLVVRDGEGRVLAVDLDRRRVLANLRVQL